MKSHILVNNSDGHQLELSNPEGIKSPYLEEIKPTDDPITRMLKGWAHNVHKFDDVIEYHGIVRDAK